MEWLGLVIVLGSLVGVIPGVVEQYRKDRAGFFRTLRLFAAYMLYVVAGLFVVTTQLTDAPSGRLAGAAIVFLIAYIFYGGLWLLRRVPRYRELPAFIDRFPGTMDYIFWAVLAATLAMALFG